MAEHMYLQLQRATQCGQNVQQKQEVLKIPDAIMSVHYYTISVQGNFYNSTKSFLADEWWRDLCYDGDNKLRPTSCHMDLQPYLSLFLHNFIHIRYLQLIHRCHYGQLRNSKGNCFYFSISFGLKCQCVFKVDNNCTFNLLVIKIIAAYRYSEGWPPGRRSGPYSDENIPFESLQNSTVM